MSTMFGREPVASDVAHPEDPEGAARPAGVVVAEPVVDGVAEGPAAGVVAPVGAHEDVPGVRGVLPEPVERRRIGTA